MFWGPSVIHVMLAGVLIQVRFVLDHRTATSQQSTQINMACPEFDYALLIFQLWIHLFSSGHSGSFRDM